MRSGADLFFERWSDPEFQQIGANRANLIVTCEPDWYLTVASEGLGNWPVKKRPVRWWQREDNSQVEIEIPNVKAVGWEKSIDSDAATCTVTLTNQWMKTNFAAALANELGMPGYFTFDHGESPEARARWNHETNSWRGRLVPGALIRTYEGNGGYGKTREDAVADGDIMLTGVWLVDDVTIGARSKLIELRCRNMMALLIDQIIYPDLVPPGLYPLRYQRWIDTTERTNYTPHHPTPPAFGAGAAVSVSYEWSSTDAWYGPNALLHGHRGTDSLDGNHSTYWLSVGNSGPDKPFATDYVQYNVGGQSIGGLEVTCWAGGYQMFVSVMENGRWLGDEIIPYDPSSLYGTQPTVVDTGANIPYVMQVGCPTDESPFVVALPRQIQADRIRITFRHLYNSGIGPWLYRAGVREFRALVSVVSAGGGRFFGWHGLESHPTADGYWTLSYEGKVHAFGHCVFYGDDYGKSNETWVGITATPSGEGYWLLAAEGRVAAFGDAVHHGEHIRDVPTDFSAASIARTFTGDGYWVGYYGGAIYGFGDAPDYTDVPLGSTPAFGDWVGAISHIVGHDSDYGLWIMTHDGEVHVRGVATDYGIGGAADEHLGSIDAMPGNDGYLLLSAKGEIRPLGSAVGAPVVSGHTGPYLSTPDAYQPGTLLVADTVVVNFDGSGYWVLSRDGEIYSRGNANRWGSPKEGVATTRRDGNYKDYADIVKDLLLWSGYWLEGAIALNAGPEVYGNIETTGIYSPDPLPPDMFDKKHPIDPIKQLKEIVGYICWVDDQGAFRWESPNWWQSGNFYDSGGHTDFIPEIDERLQLTDYTARFTKDKDRSKIIVTTDEPTAGFNDTVTTEYTPSHSLLRGMVIPAMIKVPNQVTKDEQEIMAELVALHMWFARRVGNVTIHIPNPAIQINDQVRIFERVTSETYIHYVRGISSTHDRETGVWQMTLTTNWLGTEDGDWAITAEEILPVGGEPGAVTGRFVISEKLAQFLAGRTKSTVDALPVLLPTADVDGPDLGDGAAAT